MTTFAFETTIDAVVRVQAADEDSARKAVPTVLAAPGIADILPTFTGIFGDELLLLAGLFGVLPCTVRPVQS